MAVTKVQEMTPVETPPVMAAANDMRRNSGVWRRWRRVRTFLSSWIPPQSSLPRFVAVLSLDACAVMVTLAIALLHRGLEPAGWAGDGRFYGVFTATAIVIFFLSGLYRRSWRYLSFGDCIFLGAAVTAGLTTAWLVTTVTVAAAVEAVRSAGVLSPDVMLIHWALTLVAMSAMRIVRRSLREFRRKRRSGADVAQISKKRVLLLGELEWARAMIELVKAEATSDLDVVGVLTHDGRDRSLQLSGIPVLGSPDMLPGIITMLDLRNRRPECIVMHDDGETLPKRDFIRLVSLAERLQLTIARASDPWGAMSARRPKIDLEYLPIAELLGRPEIKLERGYVSSMVAGRRIMVTGAGGTIGGELVRQLAEFAPAEIVLLDHAEYNLYVIDMEIREKFPDIAFHTALCSIRQREAVRAVFARHRPEIVFHAAALKHVPLVEANPCAGVHTNVIGTRNIADAVCEYGAQAMVQVSTDKAVNPIGMMGATKRAGELYCQALDLIGQDDENAPRFMTVRFGNVLGSSGSLIPLFMQQLAQGKPLTVTHPDIERYFMTVKEAVQLILQSSARAMHEERGRGAIFVLDMGKPVKIIDIARRMIRLAGLEPDKDVEIRIVGLRPGEKLFEELFDTSEQQLESSIPGVFEARPIAVPLVTLSRVINQLEILVRVGDVDEVCRLTHELIKVPQGDNVMDSMFEADTAGVDVARASMSARMFFDGSAGLSARPFGS